MFWCILHTLAFAGYAVRVFRIFYAVFWTVMWDITVVFFGPFGKYCLLVKVGVWL